MKKLQLTGHLGKDAVLLKQKEGQKHFTVNFSLAHSETYEDKDGKEQTNTDWVSCFKHYKENPVKVLNFLKKGLKVYVDGKPTFGLQTGGTGVYISISLNVQEMEFMSKKQEQPKEGTEQESKK